MSLAAIFGCSGPRLTEAERDFFAEVRPWGFILFKRNVETPAQVAELTAALRASVGDDRAPVLIDQEGGRVQRMGPPHWPKYPPGAAYLKATNDPLAARELSRLGARLMAHDLKAVGVDVDCAPVLDVPVPGAHDIIGDRAYAQDPATVSQLGRAAAEGLLAGGVLPVIKHMPGHGRAFADSHHELPVVKTSLEELEAWDFAPFRALSDMPLGMTAHVVYTAWDPDLPASLSASIIDTIIRQRIGFDGLLMSDDLDMKALNGSIPELAAGVVAAGCDLALNCWGRMDDMVRIADLLPDISDQSRARLDRAMASTSLSVENPPLDQLLATRDSLLSVVVA